MDFNNTKKINLIVTVIIYLLGRCTNAQDLYVIKQFNTSSGDVEANVLSNASNHQQFSDQLDTVLGQAAKPSDRQFALADFDHDGVADLFTFFTSTESGSGMTEIHVLSGASGYSQFIDHVATPFELLGDTPNIRFVLADTDGDNIPDLVGIKEFNTGSGMVEVHVLSGASNYQQWTNHVATAQPQFSDASNIQFFMADVDRDGKPDLVMVYTTNTGTGTVELHILSGASNYQQWIAATGTGYPTCANMTFMMRDVDGDGILDLIGISTSNTGTGKVEFHVTTGASNYQQYIQHTVTGMDAPVDPLDYVYLIIDLSSGDKSTSAPMSLPYGPAWKNTPPDNYSTGPFYFAPYGYSEGGPFACSVGVGEGAQTTTCEAISFNFPNYHPADPQEPPMKTLRRDAEFLRNEVRRGEITDCQALISFVAEAADLFNTKESFIKSFSILTPNQAVVRSIPNLFGSSTPVIFNDRQMTSGYLTTYQDSFSPNSDQGHHFAAFFQLGYAYGNFAGTTLKGYMIASDWEHLEGTGANFGDVELGGKAFTMGTALKNGSLDPMFVSNTIRDEICKQ